MSIIQEALKKAQKWSAEEDAAVQDKGSGNSSVFVGDILTDKGVVPSTVFKLPSRKNRKRSQTANVIAGAITAALIIAIAALALHSRHAASKPALKEGEGLTSHQDVTYKSIAAKDAANASAGVPAKTSGGIDAPRLVLNGIMYIEDAPRAIINNAIVREGGTVAGATVVRINERSAILKKGSLEITLTLKE